MKKYQEAQSNKSGIGVTALQGEARATKNLDRQQFHKLARLRIERNRAARHARCASIRRMN